MELSKSILKYMTEAQVQLSSDGYYVDKISDEDFKVSNAKGQEYEVKKAGTNWQCTCPAFKFKGQCKHIQMLMQDNYIKAPKRRYPNEMMQPAINVIKPILDKYDPKWEIVGSYRRGKDTFKDVDIIVRCSVEEFEKLKEELNSLPNFENETGKSGTKTDSALCRGIYHDEETGLDIDLDINRMLDHMTEPAMMVYRTGPADLNMFMRVIAMSKGWSLSEKGIIDHVTGEPANVPQETEEDIFKSLGLPYLEPKQRENWESNLDTESLRSKAHEDMNKMLYGPQSVVPKITSKLKEVIDEPNNRGLTLRQRIGNSKSKDRLTTAATMIKPYIKDIVVSPYKNEIALAWQNVTGENLREVK